MTLIYRLEWRNGEMAHSHEYHTFCISKFDANVIDAMKYVKRLADRLSPIVLPIVGSRKKVSI